MQTPKFNRRRKPVSASGSGEWIYGINPVLEALKARRDIKALFISAGRHEKVGEIRKEAEKGGIPVESAEAGFFDKNFPKGHQGVAARVLQKAYAMLDDILAMPSERNEKALFVALDGIEDPRNFGAILRSADASGVHGVIIQSYRSAGIGPEASKASAGAMEYVPVSVVPNIKYAVQRMREEGITVVGTDALAPIPLWETDLTVPLCVVIGSEGRGMRKILREYCDVLVKIPMTGEIGSLNVSVATGILLFEVMRQRFTQKKNYQEVL
ncbi:MAG TPA: 23S rRNA (guanosine(2251)-2'-O)-methyltransferase RlmB [Thermodesulfovibrionales bacterium]|nr:23S rRNA (guanosine(2251)-2'-O)-methyltransferase RlmB [Thermodesulfovibrionales bacterium]